MPEPGTVSSQNQKQMINLSSIRNVNFVCIATSYTSIRYKLIRQTNLKTKSITKGHRSTNNTAFK